MLKISKNHNLFPQCVERFENEVKKYSTDLTSAKGFYTHTRRKLVFDDFEWFYVVDYDLIVRRRKLEN